MARAKGQALLQERGVDVADAAAVKALLASSPEAAFYHNKVQATIHFCLRGLPLVGAQAVAIQADAGSLEGPKKAVDEAVAGLGIRATMRRARTLEPLAQGGYPRSTEPASGCTWATAGTGLREGSMGMDMAVRCGDEWARARSPRSIAAACVAGFCEMFRHALWYDDEGYLPEAVNNYLARLGWSHGDDEVFCRDQFVEWFDLNHITPSAAQFNTQKLNWLNAHYLKQADGDRHGNPCAAGHPLIGFGGPRVTA